MNVVDLGRWDLLIKTVCVVLTCTICVVISVIVSLLSRKERRFSWTRFSEAWRDETGAAYSLGFVLFLPFYVLIICVCIECMFLMIGKYGAVHAAQAAVRAAAIRCSVVNPSDRNGYVSEEASAAAKKAAVVSMVPFASSVDADYQQGGSGEASSFFEAYQAFAEASGAPDSSDGGFYKFANNTLPLSEYGVTNRYASAAGRISVVVALDSDSNQDLPSDEPWRQCIRCDLTYECPFRLPYVGRLLGGTTSGSMVVKKIESTAWAQIECPRNQAGFLGVAIPWNVSDESSEAAEE